MSKAEDSALPPALLGLKANWPKLALFIKMFKKGVRIKGIFTFFAVFKHDKLVQLHPKSFKTNV